MIPLLALACTSGTGRLPGRPVVQQGDPQDTGTLDDDPAAVPNPPRVAINEVQPSNDSTWEDEQGQEDDWVELAACSEEAVDLSQWSLTYAPDASQAWTFPEGTVLRPGEHLVLWLDEQPDQGPLHLPWTLSADADELVLRDGEGQAEDHVTWADARADHVFARYSDCGALWTQSLLATPANANPWDPGDETDLSERLFPQDELLELDLFLPADSLDALDADPYSYVTGSLALRGVTLDDVGIHIKGQWGSLRDFDDKAAFKVDLNEYTSHTLQGLEKLTLNNMVQDPSMVNERIAYRLFRDMGVPTPRTAHVALWVNGEYRGIYLHVETPDERFLGRWFEDDEGNLYEGEYGEDLSSYTQMDHDERGSHDPDDYSDLAALAELLARTPSEDLVDELETLIDVDEWLAAMAVEVIIGHWDGYFWYPNNYRIYHDPSTGQLSLLPWGVDQTFGYEGDIYGASGQVGRWCMAVPSLKARYKRALWIAAERMDALELADDAQRAHRLVTPWYTSPWEEHSYETSKAYLNSTLSFLATRPEGILGQLFD